jgi:hypothetical protein
MPLAGIVHSQRESHSILSIEGRVWKSGRHRADRINTVSGTCLRARRLSRLLPHKVSLQPVPGHRLIVFALEGSPVELPQRLHNPDG